MLLNTSWNDIVILIEQLKEYVVCKYVYVISLVCTSNIIGIVFRIQYSQSAKSRIQTWIQIQIFQNPLLNGSAALRSSNAIRTLFDSYSYSCLCIYCIINSDLMMSLIIYRDYLKIQEHYLIKQSLHTVTNFTMNYSTAENFCYRIWPLIWEPTGTNVIISPTYPPTVIRLNFLKNIHKKLSSFSLHKFR